MTYDERLRQARDKMLEKWIIDNGVVEQEDPYLVWYAAWDLAIKWMRKNPPPKSLNNETE